MHFKIGTGPTARLQPPHFNFAFTWNLFSTKLTFQAGTQTLVLRSRIYDQDCHFVQYLGAIQREALMLADLIVSLSRGSPPSHNAQWQSVAAKNEEVFNIFPEASIAHDIFHLTELDQHHLSAF